MELSSKLQLYINAPVINDGWDVVWVFAVVVVIVGKVLMVPR